MCRFIQPHSEQTCPYSYSLKRCAERSGFIGSGWTWLGAEQSWFNTTLNYMLLRSFLLLLIINICLILFINTHDNFVEWRSFQTEAEGKFMAKRENCWEHLGMYLISRKWLAQYKQRHNIYIYTKLFKYHNQNKMLLHS